MLIVQVIATTVGGDFGENDKGTDISVRLKVLLRNLPEEAEESHKNWSE